MQVCILTSKLIKVTCWKRREPVLSYCRGVDTILIMNRIVSFLLIPFFLLGQLPHSHAWSGVAEAKEHASRPHVHLHGHSHAHDRSDHDHASSEGNTKSRVVKFLSPPDHDSDAVYLGPSRQIPPPCPSIAVDVLLGSWISFPRRVIVGEQFRYYIADPPESCARLPIYLLKSSLLL